MGDLVSFTVNRPEQDCIKWLEERGGEDHWELVMPTLPLHVSECVSIHLLL